MKRVSLIFLVISLGLVIPSGVLAQSRVGDQCVMKNGLPGTCTEIIKCDWYIRGRSSGSISDDQVEICSGQHSTICCSSENDYSSYQNPTTTEPTMFMYRMNNKTTAVAKSPAKLACDYYIDDSENFGIGEKSGEYPHMAILLYEIESAVCAGTIINEVAVLTAAHCVQMTNNKLVKILAGDTRRNGSPDNLYDIEEIITHPNYSSELPQNDIAIIKVKEFFLFGPRLYAACLHLGMTDLPPTRVLSATGWEHQAPFISNMYVRTQQNLTTVPLPECEENYREQFEKSNNSIYHIIDSQLCATGKPNNDTCKRDSGGPLTIQYSNRPAELVGIASIGDPCSAFPLIYTRIAKYISWIEEHVEFYAPS